MSDYINKIKKGEVEYDIQDARVPEINAGAEGKVLKVDGGAAVWGDAAGGDSWNGELISIVHQGSDTLDSLLTDLNVNTTSNPYFLVRLRVFQGSPTDFIGFFNFQYEGVGWGVYAYVTTSLTFTSGFKKSYCSASTGLSNITFAQFINNLTPLGGGTQLYKHEFTLSKPHPAGAGTIDLAISIVSLSSTPITELSSMYGAYFFVHDGYLVKNMIDGFSLANLGPNSAGYTISYIDFNNQTLTNWIDANTTISVSDTVTAL